MMRKIFFSIAIFVFVTTITNAQSTASTQGILQNATDVVQIYMPLEIYVGDVVELKYSFRSAVDFFSDVIIEKEIDVERFPFENSGDLFTVKGARFIRNDKDFVILMQIIPWRAGVMNIPNFDLYSVLGMDESERNKNISYTVLFEPIEIKSIIEKTGCNEIQSPLPPFIIPGTTYVIFGIVLFAIILLVVFFRMIIKISDFKQYISMLKVRYARRRNSVIALRKVKRLLRTPSISDIEFCAGLQNLTRAYLSFRFDYPFASASAISVRECFRTICLGDIPTDIAYSVEDLTSMFIRTDYIRYAHDSLDSKREPQSEYQARLAKNERKSLSEMVVKAIKLFESEQQEGDANVF